MLLAVAEGMLQHGQCIEKTGGWTLGLEPCKEQSLSCYGSHTGSDPPLMGDGPSTTQENKHTQSVYYTTEVLFV